MSALDDFLQSRRNPAANITYAQPLPTPSLSDQKKLRLFGVQGDKQNRISPDNSAYNAIQSLTGSTGANNSSLLDFAQAGLYRAGGNLHDVGGDAINGIFGTDINTAADDGLSYAPNADFQAGVTKEDRALFQQDTHNVYKNIADKNYWEAFKGSLALAPRLAADSAATALEIGAGAALTAGLTVAAPPVGAAVGATLLGRRGKRAVDAIEAVSEGVDKAKSVSMMRKSINAVAKGAGQQSIMTADLVQQQRNDFKAANNGQEPSAQRLAAMIVMTGVTSAIELGIVKRFFLPKFNKAKTKVDDPVFEKFKAEMKDLTSYAGEEALVSIGKRVVKGIGKVGAAGGAEAVQEYAQTWAEILGVNTSPKEGQSVLQAAFEEIGKKENLDEALTGAFLGFGAGGATRGAIAAPSLAVGVTADVTKGAVKAGGRVLNDIADASATALLNEDERATARAAYETDKQNVKQHNQFRDASIEIVKNATSLEELRQNPQVAEDVTTLIDGNDITETDLKNKDTFKSLQAKLISNYKAQQFSATLGVEKSRSGRLAKKIGKNAIDKSIAKAKKLVGEATIEEALAVTKKLSDGAIEAISNLDSSAARGIVVMAATSTTDRTKLLVKAARALPVRDVAALADIIEEQIGEKTAREFRSQVKKRTKNLIDIKQKSTSVFGAKEINPMISEVAERGTLKTSEAAPMTTLLNDISGGKIGDEAALEQVEKAFEVYKNSDAVKNNAPGVMPENDIRKLEDRLARADKRIREPVSKRIRDVLAKTSKEIRKDGILEFFRNEESVQTLVTDLEASSVGETLRKLRDVIPDLPEFKTEHDQAIVEGQIRDALNVVSDVATAVKETFVGEEKLSNEVKDDLENLPFIVGPEHKKVIAALREEQGSDVADAAQKYVERRQEKEQKARDKALRDEVIEQADPDELPLLPADLNETAVELVDDIIDAIEEKNPVTKAKQMALIDSGWHQFITLLRAHGYESAADLDYLLENFPELKNNNAIVTRLQEAFNDGNHREEEKHMNASHSAVDTQEGIDTAHEKLDSISNCNKK